MIVLYEPEARVLRLNPAFERLTGWTTEEARSVDLMAACYPDPDYRETVRAFMAAPQEGWMDIEMTTRDGRVVATSWANIRFPDDTRIGIGIDITERKRAEDRQRLLLAELSHRVKNMLATVQSIALRSLSAGRPIEEAREAFMERLRALAETHSLLTAGEWQGASLRRLVEDVLAPYGRRVAIASEDLVLNPKAALTLGLVLHELATNAAKYGALAAPAGRVEVAWTVGGGAAAADGDDGPGLRLHWRERDGPPVPPPERVGFGRTLIERAVAYELNGTTRLDFRADGVVCELVVPLAEVTVGAT
jgi:PAS domain S-box-containing protein